MRKHEPESLSSEFFVVLQTRKRRLTFLVADCIRALWRRQLCCRVQAGVAHILIREVNV